MGTSLIKFPFFSNLFNCLWFNFKTELIVAIRRQLILILNISTPAVDPTNTTYGSSHNQNRAALEWQFFNMGCVLQFQRRIWQHAEIEWLLGLLDGQGKRRLIMIGIVLRLITNNL